MAEARTTASERLGIGALSVYVAPKVDINSALCAYCIALGGRIFPSFFLQSMGRRGLVLPFFLVSWLYENPYSPAYCFEFI